MKIRKKLWIAGIIVLLLAGVVAGGIAYWNIHKKNIIRKGLSQAVHEKSNGLYTANYKDLEMDEVNGTLSVTSFTLVYDSIRLIQLEKEKKAPFLLFKIFIPAIHVEGVETPRALLNKEIKGQHLTIINPLIEIIYTHSGKDSSRSLPDKEIYKQILGDLNLIELGSVAITGAEIITKNKESGDTLVHCHNTSVTLTSVSVDSLSDADTSRILYAREANLDCEKISWQSENKLYSYRLDSISLSSASSLIRIKNFLLSPQAGEEAFVKRVHYQTDRMDFAVHDIQLVGTDFHRLADEIIQVDTLVVNSASFRIYRDRNLPLKKESKIALYPHQAIQKIAADIEIRSAIIKNTLIEYKEKNPKTDKTGKVQFWNSQATISNITNRKEVIEKNNRLVFDIHSSLLGKIPVHTRWTFYLLNPDGKFDLSGEMGQTEAKAFNTLSEPMGPARFNSGHLNHLEFHFTGTTHQLGGKVNLLYDDLKIALLKKDDDSIHFKQKAIASLLANMKIKNANPDKGKEPRIGDVSYTRDVHKSIFNLAWKGLFEAAKEITGAE